MGRPKLPSALPPSLRLSSTPAGLLPIAAPTLPQQDDYPDQLWSIVSGRVPLDIVTVQAVADGRGLVRRRPPSWPRLPAHRYPAQPARAPPDRLPRPEHRPDRRGCSGRLGRHTPGVVGCTGSVATVYIALSSCARIRRNIPTPARAPHRIGQHHTSACTHIRRSFL